MVKKMKNKRDETIDIMKGILMSLVVMAHAQGPFHRFIYLFHMPVFIMISGYLFHNDKLRKEEIGHIIKKK